MVEAAPSESWAIVCAASDDNDVKANWRGALTRRRHSPWWTRVTGRVGGKRAVSDSVDRFLLWPKPWRVSYTCALRATRLR